MANHKFIVHGRDISFRMTLHFPFGSPDANAFVHSFMSGGPIRVNLDAPGLAGAFKVDINEGVMLVVDPLDCKERGIHIHLNLEGDFDEK